MTDPLTLFDVASEPAPVRALAEAIVAGDVEAIDATTDAVHDAGLDSAALAALSKWEAQMRAAQARTRMRPRRLVKLRCERCAYRGKMLPSEVPESCPRCARTGCLVVTGFVSR